MSYLDNHNLSEEQKFKITRYHTEEIQLILFICCTDMLNYTEEDLDNFSDCIEGRVEVLFEKKYLRRIEVQNFLKLTDSTIVNFKKLQKFLISLYSSNWSIKLKDRQIWINANTIAKQIVQDLGLVYVEPITFMSDENHLNVDWT